MARPLAFLFLIPKKFKISGPTIAPKIPVTMTNIAVSDGKPPNCSVMPMAIGVVVDLGASEISVVLEALSSFPINNADNIAVKDPVNILIEMAIADFLTFSNCW